MRAAGTGPDRVMREPLVSRRSGGEVLADAAQEHTRDEDEQLAAWPMDNDLHPTHTLAF